jgi:hypothetical protein
MDNDNSNRLKKKISGSEITGKISGAIASGPELLPGIWCTVRSNRNFSTCGSAAWPEYSGFHQCRVYGARHHGY